ncbi:hypothetical protein BHE74_00019367, partial [Ensete ventricosum]
IKIDVSSYANIDDADPPTDSTRDRNGPQLSPLSPSWESLVSAGKRAGGVHLGPLC